MGFDRRMLHIRIFVLLILGGCVTNFEIILSETKQLTNRSFEIPLYEKRNLTIRFLEFDRRDVIGVKYEIQTTNLNIIRIRQQKTNRRREYDWFIYKSHRRLFNLYPSPKVFYAKIKENQTWTIETQSMDLTTLTVRLDVFYKDQRLSTSKKSIDIRVTYPQRTIDWIFSIFVLSMVVLTSILTGIILDLESIIQCFVRPRPILIGLVAQYGLVPLLALTTAKFVQYSSLNGLVFFIIGCCPGSVFSNHWNVIFDGDINLSVTMSFVSTCISFLMIPVYFRTIGRIYTEDVHLQIPYYGLAFSLAITVIPYAIGILISYFFRQTKVLIEETIRSIFISVLFILFLFALTVNWYVFQMIDFSTMIASILLPLLSFIFTGLLASISQIHWQEMKTISIDAGIQNTAIAFLIIISSLPRSKVFVIPMLFTLLTTILLWMFLLVRNRIRNYLNSKMYE